jgi:multidrug transporter EmrE-like cation transporter
MIVAWLALAGAIALEVMATLSLRALSTGWQRLPGVLVVVNLSGAAHG